MKYFCLGYQDERAWESMPADERASLAEEAAAYAESLRRSGRFIDARAVADERSTTTLRFEHGKVSVSDLPVVEISETLTGVIVLEARDLNHAIQLMSQWPCMRPGGRLEIRPIDENVSR